MDKYDSLRHYEFAHGGLKKVQIANILGVDAPRYSRLRNPELHQTRPTERELDAIAKLLRRSVTYVQLLYRRAE